MGRLTAKNIIAKKHTLIRQTRLVLTYPCGKTMFLTEDFFDQTYKHVNDCQKCEAKSTLDNTRFVLTVARMHGKYVSAGLIEE